ncbi:MAG TPA: O-methyltransferase [Solirubrobacteraceae bacterium]|nr:O-methyltransferase [Solirubrobacteraceae bacterium]
MSHEQWDAVDDYVGGLLTGEDSAPQAALQASEAAGLPAIALSPPQGKLLHLLARIRGARRILEIGTLGGYSTIWLATALPDDGSLISLELEPSYAKVAHANVQRAGLAGLVEIRVGPALDGLRELIDEGAGPFDLTFIDADKPATPEYFQLALELSRPGSVIVADNVVRDGALADADSQDPGVLGMRRFHELLSRGVGGHRVSATTIQTVGVKGYDGFTLALVGV